MKSRTSPVVMAITMVLLMRVEGHTEALVQISEANLRKPAPAFRCMMQQAAQFNCPTTKTELCCSTFGRPGCHGCKTHTPWYMEFQNKYRDRGLTVLGASMDDDGWKVVKPFVEARKANYPVVIANDGLAKQCGLSAMPLSILIDRKGRIADSHSGVVDRDAWETEIQGLLGEPQ